MTSETETKLERNIMTTETETKLPTRLEDVADVMLAATASSNPLLRFVKGEYFIGEDEIEVGHEYIAYPFDAMIGFAVGRRRSRGAALRSYSGQIPARTRRSSR